MGRSPSESGKRCASTEISLLGTQASRTQSSVFREKEWYVLLDWNPASLWAEHQVDDTNAKVSEGEEDTQRACTASEPAEVKKGPSYRLLNRLANPKTSQSVSVIAPNRIRRN